MLLFASALLVWAFGAKGKTWPNALLSAAALGLTLLLAEGGSRLWTLASGSTHLGYAARVWQRRFGVRNRAGPRDVEHSLAPAPGRRRLLVVGDSTAVG